MSANLGRSLQKFDATFCQMMTRLVFYLDLCVSCMTTAPTAVFKKKKGHNRFNNLTPLIQSVIGLNGPAQTDTLEYNTTILTACFKTLLR